MLVNQDDNSHPYYSGLNTERDKNGFKCFKCKEFRQYPFWHYNCDKCFEDWCQKCYEKEYGIDEEGKEDNGHKKINEEEGKDNKDNEGDKKDNGETQKEGDDMVVG